MTGYSAIQTHLSRLFTWPSIFPVYAETWARLTGREPFITMDGLNMAKKHMYFTSAKARAALGYNPRPAAEALADAVAWFRENGHL